MLSLRENIDVGQAIAFCRLSSAARVAQALCVKYQEILYTLSQDILYTAMLENRRTNCCFFLGRGLL